MHQRLLNQARLWVSLRPRGPILVKSGLDTPDPTRPDMEFVRTRHARLGDTIYLPGTSLKGAFRSHAERALRGAGIEVCDPLARKGDPARRECGERKDYDRTTAAVYKRHCPACRTFGSLGVAGRCSVQDAYPWPPDADEAAMIDAARVANLTERRAQVSINRKTGAADGGKLFDLEVAVNGDFHTEIHLQNFQLWQLGLLVALLRDVDSGDAPIGFGKSRGLGQVGVSFRHFQCEWSGAADALYGAGALSTPDERAAYGLTDGDRMALPAGVTARRTWRGQRLSVAPDDGLQALLDGVVDGPLLAYVERHAPARQG
jgi:CRISPR-associated RAMP protein (TIGR02581 family)